MTNALPTTRSLKLAYTLSILTASLMTVLSIAGIAGWQRVYLGMEPKMLPLFRRTGCAQPRRRPSAPAGSMWLARRGALVGLLMWPGALFYVLYDYGYYALGAPFNVFFVAYLALIRLSAYALIA